MGVWIAWLAGGMCAWHRGDAPGRVLSGSVRDRRGDWRRSWACWAWARLLSAIVFLAASGIVFATLRPVARRHRRLPPAIRTGAAALIGKPAIVIERIANDEGVGCVKIDGEVWTARSYDQDEVIDDGRAGRGRGNHAGPRLW